MQLINFASLVRGATLIDLAFSNNCRSLSLSVADLVGVVAAYINRGLYIGDMEERIGKTLDPGIGERAKRTFDLFDDWNGKGLWMQGPAMDDIRFIEKTLADMYPDVNAANDRLLRPVSAVFADTGPGLDADIPF